MVEENGVIQNYKPNKATLYFLVYPPVKPFG